MTAPSFVVVLPAIDPQLADECLGSMCPQLRERTFLIDNTITREIARVHAKRVMFVSAPGKNTGVTKPWNQGVALAKAMGCDYTILLSQSIRFGASGGRDFLAELEQRRPEWIMHGQHGWKLIAINMQLFEVVGRFDPVFESYRNEVDLLYRAHVAGLPSVQYNDGRFDQIVVDATSAGDAVALKRGLVTHDFDASTRAWHAKWGGEKLEETFDHPYNDSSLDWTHVGPPPVRAKESA